MLCSTWALGLWDIVLNAVHNGLSEVYELLFFFIYLLFSRESTNLILYRWIISGSKWLANSRDSNLKLLFLYTFALLCS